MGKITPGIKDHDFWDRFIQCIRKVERRPTFIRHYVLRVERYLRAMRGSDPATHLASDVESWLQRAGRSSRLDSWQFVQIVNALQLFFEEQQGITMSPTGMLLNLMTFTLLPLAIGMLLRYFFPGPAERAVEPIRKSILYLMIVVLLLGVISSYQDILEYFAVAGLLVIAMNIITMGLGYGIARWFKLPLTQVITITFEVGVQNLALSFAITFNLLQRPDLAIAALIYAAVMPATALGFVSIARRLLDRQERETAQA